MSMTLPTAEIIVLTLALYCLLTIGQTLHCVTLAHKSTTSHKRLRLSYETSLAIHLLLGALLMNSLAHYWLPPYVLIGMLHVPLQPLMWVNAAALLLGIAVMLESRSPLLILELIPLVLTTLLFFDLSQDLFILILAVDLIIFTYRVTDRLIRDLFRRKESVSPLSIASTIKAMPEGLVYATDSGEVLLVNDAMRRLLAQLGISADLSDLDRINKIFSSAAHLEDPLLISVDSQIWQLSRDEISSGKKTFKRILAVDITEEYLVEKEIEQQNRELASAKQKLEATLDGIQETVEAETLVHMRSRLHDVIGQRLSLLHRYLEDGQRNPGKLEEMKPLLKGIINDLHEDTVIDWQVELLAVVSTFALVGVAVDIEGEAPADPTVALTCTNIIREAATNAVRHGNATKVQVHFKQLEKACELVITDNGSASAQSIPHEGQGIAGMRAAIARCGGSFALMSSPTFTIHAQFPNMNAES